MLTCCLRSRCKETFIAKRTDLADILDDVAWVGMKVAAALILIRIFLI